MRVPTTTAAGPVASSTQDMIDTEFSHNIRTNFSGHVNDITGGIAAGAGLAATVSDLIPGVGTAVGIGFGAIGLAADAVKTVGDCGTGLGDDSCTGDLASDTLAAASFGTAQGAGSFSEIGRIGGDVLGNINDGLSVGGYYG